MEADALATSVFVMGPDDGMELVESLDNVETLIIDSEGKVTKSSGLLEYIK
jgi:thiamine biosynthesis lipoprotein